MPGTSRRSGQSMYRGAGRPATGAPKPGPVRQTSQPSQGAADKSSIDFHRGNMLTYVANTYPTLPRTILEGIQNGFDAGGDRILVLIDHKSREVFILDNGDGTDREQFEQALNSVGASVKNKDKKARQLGRFGLGLISPLTKCTSYTFSSRRLGFRQALRWEFRLESIRHQRTKLEIPVEALSDLPSVPKRFAEDASGEFQQRWSTLVHMRGVTNDRVASTVDLDDLAFNIQTKFMAPMRERKALVRLVLIDSVGRKTRKDVNPLQFTGEPLPVISFDDVEETGLVEFELYRARRVGGQRKGKVSMVETASNYPITMREFMAQARGLKDDGVISEAMTALNSGYFEGIIRCEKVKLHEGRNKFVVDDALRYLYLQIDRWYTEYGHTQYQSEQDLSRHSRWQELGLKTLNHLHELKALPLYAKLFDNLKEIVDMGRMGEGHVEPASGKPDGPDEDPSIRVGQGGAGVPKGSGTSPRPKPPSQRVRPQVDRPGDFPMTSLGPNGRPRTLVKGDSEGLQLAHAEWPGDSRLWDFDFRDGTLTFNTLHKVWIALDETNGKHTRTNEKWILQLQEMLTIKVLNLLLHAWEPEEFEQRRVIIDSEIRPEVELLVVGKPLTA